MAIVPFGPFDYPQWLLPRPDNGANQKATGHIINGASDIIEYALNVDASGTIESVHLETGTIVATGNIHVAIQRMGSSANGPDGHGDGTDVVFATQSITVSNTTHEFGPLTDDGTASGTKMVVSAGDVIAVRIKRGTSSSFNGPFLFINSGAAAVESMDQVPQLTPNLFRSTNGGSTWSFTQGMANCAIEYEDGSFVRQGMACVEFFFQPDSFTIGLNTTPDEIGIRIIPESTIQVSGFTTLGDNGEAECKVYDASDTVLTSVKTGFHGGSSGHSQKRTHFFPEHVTLIGGEVYRLTLSYLSAAAGQGLAGYDVALNKRLASQPAGIECYRTERTDGGAWTDTTDQRLAIWFVVNGIDTAAPITINDKSNHMVRAGIANNASVGRIF